MLDGPVVGEERVEPARKGEQSSAGGDRVIAFDACADSHQHAISPSVGQPSQHAVEVLVQTTEQSGASVGAKPEMNQP
jgi:hypothetical protein